MTPRSLARSVVTFAVLASACGEGRSLGERELRDPLSCEGCHPDHYREWSRSMHAYAAEDPVFRAMNARGQRETQGALGDFCVKCHAPVAVRTGATVDGLNLDEVPAYLHGVTCWFCHSVDAVEGTHDAALRLSEDGVLRGGIADPLPTEAHRSAYSPLHDREDPSSASLCGACHDIVTPAGVHLERTYAEWQSSIFATSPTFGLTCGQCHMEGRDGPAARVPGAPVRRVHGHSVPGVDLALTPAPGTAEAAEEVARALDGTLSAQLCVEGPPGAAIWVVLDNVGAGHRFPSGASQDRRIWVEVIAYEGDEVAYQSGVVKGGSPPEGSDPDQWMLRECLFGQGGEEVHMFWEAASVRGNALLEPETLDPRDPRYYRSHVARRFPGTGSLPALPDRVTMRVRVQPMSLAVLDDLVASGDLDPAVRAAMRTLDIEATRLEWSLEAATGAITTEGQVVRCVSNAPFSLVSTSSIGRSLSRCDG